MYSHYFRRLFAVLLPVEQGGRGTIGNCYAFGYYSCMADTRSPETACNDGEDNDCDNAIDCLDSDCAGAINCPATCATNKLCAVGCVRAY